MSIIRVFSPLPDSEKIYEIRVQDCQPLQFVNRFIGTSILTLGVAEANDAAHFLQEGCWLVTEDATPYIIMHRQQSENRVDVIAYSAHIGLDGRVTVPPAGEYAIESTGSADKVVKDFIRASLAELNRGLNITCAADQPGDEISDQSRYKPLGEEVVRVLTSAGRGERFTWGTSDITFDTYTGVDRSVSNTEENPVCIFAGRLKNLAGYTYKVDKTVEKTTPYVAGQGQGEEREIYVLGNDAAGWARREVFVDARDIEHGDLAKLQERGNQAKVPVGTQIVAEARDNVNLVYGADYNLGDIVTVQIPSRGFTKNASGFFEKVTDISSFDLRVTEVTITYDSGARTVDVAFGEVVRSQIARVANEVAQLKSTEAPPAAAIDLSNVQPSTIMDIIGVGDNDIWHTGNLYHVEWTPYLRGVNANPSVTYIRQRGMAAKIGPLVIAPFEILTDTVSGGSGHAYIHGTPFPAYSGQAGLPYSALVYNDDITGVTVKQMGIFWNGSYWILAWGTASERLQADNLLNGFHVFGTLIYHTSA